MCCTVAKCWPEALDPPCNGNLQPLSQFTSNPCAFLQKTASYSRFTINPKYMWQVWLTKVTASDFTVEEVASFTICESHKMYLESFFSQNNTRGKNGCSICGRKKNIRRASFQMHKDSYRVFKKVIPIASTICQECRTAIKPNQDSTTTTSPEMKGGAKNLSKIFQKNLCINAKIADPVPDCILVDNIQFWATFILHSKIQRNFFKIVFFYQKLHFT